MAERYKEPPKSLGDAAGQAWLPIRRGTLDFDTRTAKASTIGTITHQASPRRGLAPGRLPVRCPAFLSCADA